MSEFKHIIDKITATYRLFYPTTTKYAFPPETHGVFFQIEKILLLKTLSDHKKMSRQKESRETS